MTTYKLLFDHITKASTWDKEQAKTALILGLWDEALTVLEALGGEMSYGRLMTGILSYIL